MRLPKRITEALYRWAERNTRRPPDLIISRSNEPQLMRWIVFKTRFGGLYVHNFVRDDDDRALHDHPWASLSVMVKGEVVEVCREPGQSWPRVRRLAEGDVTFRPASFAHRILTDEGAWTLFFIGPKVREWGFGCPHGWRHWTKFVDMTNTGKIGRGCAHE